MTIEEAIKKALLIKRSGGVGSINVKMSKAAVDPINRTMQKSMDLINNLSRP